MNNKSKTILFIGSDLTYGTKIKDKSKTYVNILCNKLDANSFVLCSKGGCMSKQNRYYLFRPKSYIDLLDNLPDNVDLIIVEASVNDYKKGDAPLGLLSDTNEYCFSGSVHYLLSKLNDKYKDKPILFMTQLPCKRPKRTYNNIMLRTYPLVDFVNREKLIIEWYIPNVHIIDIYHEYKDLSYSNNSKDLFANNYFLNEKGHEYLANILINEITSKNLIND